MSYPINYPTPQGANVQIFKEGGSTSDWVKPQGASFVWFTLIGAGGAGDSGTTGGGSGAVTNCMVPAFLIPDVLRVSVGLGGTNTGVNGTASSIVYQQKNTTGYTLLTADGGGSVGGGGAGAASSNYFACMGFFQSVAGQSSNTGGNIAASGTTFLSAGAAGAAYSVTANYGYGLAAGAKSAGFSQMQPIIVGVGNTYPSTGASGKPGFGCGGASAGTAILGGDGLVVIITW